MLPVSMTFAFSIYSWKWIELFRKTVKTC